MKVEAERLIEIGGVRELESFKSKAGKIGAQALLELLVDLPGVVVLEEPALAGGIVAAWVLLLASGGPVNSLGVNVSARACGIDNRSAWRQIIIVLNSRDLRS